MLVALVLLTAIVVPRVGPRTVPGRGEMAPVPGPPSAGDCVLLPVDHSTQVVQAGSRVPSYLPAQVGACGSSRYGEVASVLTTSTTEPAVADSAPSDPAILDVDRCTTAVSRYSGLAQSTPATLLTYWQPAATLGTAVAGPTPLQVAMGQHWLACITFVAGIDGRALRYDHTVRDGYSTGHLPRAASQCLLTADPAAQRVECTAPHQAELFGSAVGEVPAPDLQPSCMGLVKELTGIPDPGRGGS